MPPKPFPFPIGVGVDICRVNRIAALLRKEHIRNIWARKVFTRLEWPAVCRRFQRTNRSEAESVGDSERAQDTVTDKRDVTEETWKLPNLSKHSEVLEDETAFWSTIADGRSKLSTLAQYLAGRWAAKEATIKAHRHRSLHMQDISIVHLQTPSSKTRKAVALIDPVCNSVEMSEHVAASRGLRGFSPQSLRLRKGALLIKNEDDGMLQTLDKKTVHFNRRRKIQESDRQTAEINISHDGDYAVAMCIAFDSPDLYPEGRHVIDDGTGPPMHEPQWGDDGWFSQDASKKDEQWEHVSLDDLLEDSEPLTNTGAHGLSFQKSFESTELPDHWKIPPLP